MQPAHQPGDRARAGIERCLKLDPITRLESTEHFRSHGQGETLSPGGREPVRMRLAHGMVEHGSAPILPRPGLGAFFECSSKHEAHQRAFMGMPGHNGPTGVPRFGQNEVP